MANFITIDYKGLDGKLKMNCKNCELFDILAEIESEDDTTIKLKNCTVRWDDIYLKISHKMEYRFGFLLSYGIVNFDDFILMIQTSLNTRKNIIFSDLYTDDDYTQQVTPEVIV